MVYIATLMVSRCIGAQRGYKWVSREERRMIVVVSVISD